MNKVLQPPGWPRARGYSQGIAAQGTQVFVSGQIGWNTSFEFETDEFVAQARAALQNVLTVLAEAGGGPQHITRMVWYVVSRAQYLACQKELGPAYRGIMGDHYPSMTAVQVCALMEDRALLEIEATAVI